MTNPINKAEEYANRKVPNPDRNDAPYYTSRDRWQDVYDAYEAGEKERELYIKNLEAQSIGYFDNWEIANEEVERLKKEYNDLVGVFSETILAIAHYDEMIHKKAPPQVIKNAKQIVETACNKAEKYLK